MGCKKTCLIGKPCLVATFTLIKKKSITIHSFHVQVLSIIFAKLEFLSFFEQGNLQPRKKWVLHASSQRENFTRKSKINL